MSEESLGQFLRSQREKKGLTIEQVASATKISVRLLHAIENDQYVDLPAKPFIRGFVIAYARFVGFSGKEALTRFGAFIDNKASERPSLEGAHSGYAFERKSTERSRTILWIMMVSFVVLAGIGMLVLNPRFKHRNLKKLRAAHSRTVRPTQANAKNPNQKDLVRESVKKPSDINLKPEALTISVSDPASKKETQKKKKTEPIANDTSANEVKAVEKKVSASGAKKIPRDLQADPFRVPKPSDPQHKGDAYGADEIAQKVVFRTLQDVWIRYQVDSKPVTQFVLKQGRWIVFRANDLIRFQVADPQSVEIRYGSREFKSLSAYNEKISSQNKTPTLTFPFDRAQQLSQPFPGLAPLQKINAANRRGESESATQ